MTDTGFPIQDGLRRDLIDYHKWVVSIAVFVLTTSLALASFLGSPPNEVLLAWGWVLLAFSILVNWLLVKSLISGGTVAATPVDEWTMKHFVFARGWLRRLKVFGAAQQLAFVVGAGLVVTAFVIRLFGGES